MIISPTFHKIATLTVALSILTLSGCALFGSGDDAFEELRNEVLSQVHHEERAEAMLASLDQLDALLTSSAEVLADAAQQEHVLFVDYDSTPQDFEELFSETSRKRHELQEAMLHVHVEFKAKATAEEWEALLPVHANAVGARVSSLVAAAVDQRGDST